MTDAEADEALALALEFEEKASLDDMIRAVTDRRFAVYCQQKFRLIVGDLDKPLAEPIREVAVLMGLEDFLHAIRTKPAEVARRLQKRGANAEA
jgi:hypothetical protein